jgi:hypothetical protein
MRYFQLIVFGVGVVAFLVSAGFTGSWVGDTLWKVGMATMLSNVVCLQLWPTKRAA